MFWKWSKKKEQVYHVGNEDVAVEVHTGKVAHEQAAQQDTGRKKTSTTKTWPSQRCISPHKRKVIRQNKTAAGPARTAFMPARQRFLFCYNSNVLSGALRRGPKVFFIIYSLLFISQVFSASHWCMCFRIRAKAVAVFRIVCLKVHQLPQPAQSATDAAAFGGKPVHKPEGMPTA